MVQINIRISEHSARLIKRLQEKREFSSWVQKKIQEELKDEVTLKKEITEFEHEIEKRKEALKIMKEWNKSEELNEEEQKEITREEIDYWKKTILILNDKPDLIQGRINLYNNLFNKNLNKPDYLIKLNKMKDFI